jgi:hypothetical protein
LALGLPAGLVWTSGRRRACGSGCMRCCWRGSRRRVRSSGREPSSTPATCRRKGGSETGPSPVDRARLGSKHHLLVQGGGIPLAWALTGGNRHDSTQLIPLVDRVPPVRGNVGQAATSTQARHRRPRLRLPEPPPRAPPARHQSRDRTPQHRARLRAGPLPLGRRAHLRLAAPIQTTARPLGPTRRHP